MFSEDQLSGQGTRWCFQVPPPSPAVTFGRTTALALADAASNEAWGVPALAPGRVRTDVVLHLFLHPFPQVALLCATAAPIGAIMCHLQSHGC